MEKVGQQGKGYEQSETHVKALDTRNQRKIKIELNGGGYCMRRD